MITKPIKSVVIEFDDGTIETHELPDSAQGFYRERYTYQQRADTRRVEYKLLVREIHWTIREEPNAPA